MTAKEQVLEQAARALMAAEGSLPDEPGRRAEALRRAAALRARQSETVDAATLVREGRDELERRTN